MFVDYVQNGRGFGQVAEAMVGTHFETGLWRPYYDQNGQRCVTVNTGKRLPNGEPEKAKHPVSEMIANGLTSPVFNATSLRRFEWERFDEAIVRAQRQRLKAWADLAGSNTFGGFNGMSYTVLLHETMSDPGEAVVDMDGRTLGRSDAPQYQIQSLPLPITHADFSISSRTLATSRNTGTPIDSTMAEACARRVAETVERTVIGTQTGLTFGATPTGGRASTVFGYTNFPARNVKTDLTVPTGGNPEAVVQDVLEMRDQLYNDFFYGPFMLYHSTAYDIFFDNDYFRAGGTSVVRTLRERLESIDGISGVRRLDFLSPDAPNQFVLLMVQMTAEVARAVMGMEMTTIQWESIGGMELNFKVMTIMVPQIRADFNDRCGIVHATTS